ncbi:MAG: ferredoxin family protein [Anaerolineae bacterium]|nr:ferredoxin family protein [Anaerolineae bacterium]
MARGTIVIDQERCKGCELCTLVCSKDLIQIDTAALNTKGYHPAALHDDGGICTGCALCAAICPDISITVYREAPAKRPVALG